MVAMVPTCHLHIRCLKWNESTGGLCTNKIRMMKRDSTRWFIKRRQRLTVFTVIIIVVSSLLITDHLYHMLQRPSSIESLNQSHLFRYANVTWPRKRIPRIIHQTYRIHTIPDMWNATVQSVMTMNANQFQYRRWSHVEMDAFVRQYETDFYWNTYVHYRYDIQRIDSFRYILLFHVGGIYIDMDDACHRSLRDFVNTMEAIDPHSTHLALFPSGELFGIQNNFMISTTHHPIYKQMISRLPLFHHNYLIYHVTVLLSVGPLYATIQEYFFQQTNDCIVRRLDHQTYRELFWKTKGGSWFHHDTLLVLEIYYNRHRILWYLFILAICSILWMMTFIACRQKQKYSIISNVIERNSSNRKRKI